MIPDRYIRVLTENTSKFLRVNAKLIWSFVIGFVFFEIARLVYFYNHHLLGLEFLGEMIVGIAAFTLTYSFGKSLVDYFAHWLQIQVSNVFKTVLYDFWVNQSAKLIDSLRQVREGKDDKSLVDNEENYYVSCPPIVLDTSAIIDARILGVLKCGFIDNNIIVTQSVINELKNMADKSNKSKKDKGKRGLDILNDIKKVVGKKRFYVIDTKLDPKDTGGVDQSLLNFCVKHKAKIATLDFTLNKAAQVSGIEVLNVNKLANEIKINLSPGDVVLLKLLQEGKEVGQSVGYLEDGTMIVVRESTQHLGEHREVVIEKVIQTDAGRMVFAYLNGNNIK